MPENEWTYVQRKCDMLLANNPAFSELEIDLHEVSDVDVERIAAALKKNSTIKEVQISDGLRLQAELELSSALFRHPVIEKLTFYNTEFSERSILLTSVIKENENLKHLRLDNCYVCDDEAECLQWIIAQNALESLALVCCRFDSRMINHAIRVSRSLKEFTLEIDYGFEDFPVPLLVDAVCFMAKENQYPEKLDLDLADALEGSALITRISRAVTGHKSLKSLSISLETDLDENAALAMRDMLSNTPTLCELDLTELSIEATAAWQLVTGLRNTNCAVEKLSLTTEYFDEYAGDFGTNNFRALLASNRRLKSLRLSSRSIGNNGARALAGGLEQDCALEELILYSNGIGDEGVATIATALRSNRSLKALNLAANDYGVDGVVSIAEMLEHNTTLENIICPFRGTERRGLQAHAKIGHLVTLNRGGRRILSSQPEVPRNYWSRILANSSDKPDVLYFFLREKPDVLIPRLPMSGRKRKRTSSGVGCVCM